MFAKFKTKILTDEEVAELKLPSRKYVDVVRFTNRKGDAMYVVVKEETGYDFNSVSFWLYDKECRFLEDAYTSVQNDRSFSTCEPKQKTESKTLFLAGFDIPSDRFGKKFYRKAAWAVAAYKRKMRKMEKRREAQARKEVRENTPACVAVKKFFSR